MCRRICPINRTQEELGERTPALKTTWDVIWGSRLKTDPANQYFVDAQMRRYFTLNNILEAPLAFLMEGCGIIWEQ